jgi:hypothetical protein
MAEFGVAVFEGYAVAGAVFALLFVAFGIQRVDPVAEHAPIGFRLMVAPGAAALWPLLLVRWMRSTR